MKNLWIFKKQCGANCNVKKICNCINKDKGICLYICKKLAILITYITLITKVLKLKKI